MTTGVGFDGSCFTDGASALAAWRETFPLVSDSAVVSLNSSSESGGVVTFNVNRFQYSDGTTSTAGSSVTLTTCDVGALSLRDVFEVPSNQAAVDAWALGFIFPMLIGLIAWGIAQVGNQLGRH